jgi:hypothetical protein
MTATAIPAAKARQRSLRDSGRADMLARALGMRLHEFGFGMSAPFAG